MHTYTCIHTYIHTYIHIYIGFSGSSVGKESAYNAGDPSLIPESRRSPGEWNGYTFQYLA